jgi:hypothetical protein
MAKEDSDFDPIRDEPAFQELISREIRCARAVLDMDQRPSIHSRPSI